MKICPMCGASYDDANVFCTVDGAALRSLADGNDLIHTVIADRYLITEQLGEGGMGRVYLAKHVRLPQKWAIKVLHPALVRDAGALARFNQEAASASRIENRHVARVIDFGETGDGVLYLAMEYVDGESLSKLIEREGALDPRRAAEITRQVAEALAAAHELGIVHRDLKPDNIMVGRTRGGADDIRVVDFGIAKVIQQDDSEKMTRTGFAIGTPEYMSPEQISAGSVDGRSDVYSLGLVTFRMLTGLLPFPADTPQERMMMRVTHQPRTLSETRSDVAWPATLEAVLGGVLARDADERHQSATAFAQDLSRAVEEWLPSQVAETSGGVSAQATAAASVAGATPARATTPITSAAQGAGSTAPAAADSAARGAGAAAAPGTAGSADRRSAAAAKARGASRGASPTLRRGVMAIAVLAIVGVGGTLLARSNRGVDSDGGVSQGGVASGEPAADSGIAAAGAADAAHAGESSRIPGSASDSTAIAAGVERVAATPGGAGQGGSPRTPTDRGDTRGELATPARTAEVSHDTPRATPPLPGAGVPRGAREGGSEASAAAIASRARAKLDGLQAMVENLTESGARRAKGAIPGVLPDLPTRSDTVEAWYYGLQANLILGDVQEACRIVGDIGTDARSTPFAVPVKIFSDSLRCR